MGQPRFGRRFFDLSVCGPSLAALKGPGPLFRKQKQGAAGAIFEDKPPLNKQIPMHFGHQSISATIQPPHQPNPTDPSRRPLDRPTDPHNSTLGAPWVPLGTRPDGPWGPGPPSGPLFFVFVFSHSLAATDTPGRPQTERSKNLRPAAAQARTAAGPKAQGVGHTHGTW